MRSHVFGIASCFVLIVTALMGLDRGRTVSEVRAAEPPTKAAPPEIVADSEEGIEVVCKSMQSIFIPDNPVFAAYILKIQSNEDLICIERSEPVYSTLLTRYGIHSKYRGESIAGLAKLRKTDTLTEWVKAVQRVDANGITLEPVEAGDVEPTEVQTAWVLAHFAKLLSDFDARQLATKRDALQQLALKSKRPAVRTIGYVALATADNSADAAWQLASQHQIVDLLRGVRHIVKSEIRADLYDEILPLVTNDSDVSVQIGAMLAIAHVPGHDTEVFATLSDLIAMDVQRDVAISALLETDSANWPADALDPLAENLVKTIAAIPADARTGLAGKQAMSLVNKLAALMPADSAADLRLKLAGLRVTTIHINTVLEEMAYNHDVVILPGGRAVEILFANADAMPHNLVIGQPGSMEEIGMGSDRMAMQPDAAARNYVPPSDKILHHTKMLNSGQKQRLFFTAPEKPGVYPMLCTFPGHWVKMYGAVVVVRDVDEYLAAKATLPEKDALLGIMTYNHDYDTLAKQISAVESGRSFARGAAAFKMRSCISCHAIQGKGGRVGPDLTEIAKQNKPHEILRSIMFPSEKIDPKFANVEIEVLDSGKIHSGVIVPQDDETVVYLMKDPLSDCEPQIFNKGDIEIVPLKTSPMPNELLKRSSLDELWDLVAYLIAGGSAAHPAFTDTDVSRP